MNLKKLYDVDVEKRLLYSLFSIPSMFVTQEVKSEWFFNPANKTLLEDMKNVYRKEGDLNADLLSANLPEDRLRVFFDLYRSTTDDITDIAGAMGTVSGTKVLANRVKGMWQLRKIHNSLEDIEHNILDKKPASPATVKEAMDEIFKLEKEISIVETNSIVDFESLFENKINKTIESKIAGTFIPRGRSSFPTLNNLTNFFQTGLYIVAGRPAMGKTSFVNTISVDLAKTGKELESKVGVFYLETTAEQNYLRILSAETNIELQRIRLGQINEEEFNRIKEVEIELISLQKNNLLEVMDSSGINLEDLIRNIKLMNFRFGTNIFFIDQLTHIRNTEKGWSKTDEIEQTARSLSDLSKELNITIVLMHQLNREVMGRVDHRPLLSDLKSSGALEQEADVVVLLHREDYYGKVEMTGKAEWIIAKNRDGLTTTLNVLWIPAFACFKYLPTLAEQGF